MPLTKREIPDPFTFAHPGLYEDSSPEEILEDTSFAGVTGCIGQLAALSAYATEIMDSVLMIANETRTRVELTTAKSNALVRTLEKTEKQVRQRSLPRPPISFTHHHTTPQVVKASRRLKPIQNTSQVDRANANLVPQVSEQTESNI